ncbi:hypothetical protein J5N97_027207 [Dioscorea zingiberensis]|uniref:SET domain-containing protein n=1 Tax=Dioscorea zingiberensis TaxID=325984 RepID=A0A9D5C4E8_9LILI|nr:hypothetical protein J5N97_027207 [Dioscorea zingiberensis]
MVPEALCGANGGFAFKSDKKMRKGEREEEVERKGDSSSDKGRKLEERVKTKELEKGEFVPERRRKEELEKGEFVPDQWRKGELEKGEFLPDKLRKGELEKGEFVPDKVHKGELEKGEFVPDKSRKVELEKGEFVPEKWRRGEFEKGEFVPEKCRKGELEKGEFVPDKWRKWELEKGEFVPDKWRKEDLESGEFVPDKVRRGSEVERGRKVELEKGEILPDKWRKSEWEQERLAEDFRRRKDGSRGENDHRKKSSLKWDSSSHERDTKNSLRTTEEDLSQPKYDHSNGKGHGKEHCSGSLRKRHNNEPETNNRKHHGEFNDHQGSKSRRISEDGNRSNYTERPGRSLSSSVSKVSSTNRYTSSRHQESALPSRGGNDRQVRSPGHSERSPHEHIRHHDHRDRTPGYSERSPHDRTRRHDHKDRNMSHSERSPFEWARHHDHRERSPRDRGRGLDHREKSRKSGGNEKQPNIRCEERLGRRELDGKENYKCSSTKLANNSEKSSDDKSNKEKKSRHSSMEPGETLPPPPPPPLPPPPPPPPPPSHPQANGNVEEQPSMEEDMDICDTPPHAVLPSDSEMGKWYYLDHFGVEQGPSKLADLKSLVDDGVLISDHLIKHSDSDRWVTVENATSPLASSNFPYVVSDAVTQMASPPEASGNLLVETGDLSEESPISTVQQDLPDADGSLSPGVLENFQIDERVEAILNGCTIIQGKELETIGEALNTIFQYADWDKWDQSEDFTRSRARPCELNIHSRSEGTVKEASEMRSVVLSEEYSVLNVDSSNWFTGRWSCMGGDWKRNEEAAQDGSYKKRRVLNEGYPLCQMPRSGYEDPRWQRKDDLYPPSRTRKLDLPSWAFSWIEDKNDSSNDTSKSTHASRPGQVKPLVSRGTKGIMLPVIRINACVVKDQGSFEPRSRARGSERHTPRASRSQSAGGDRKSFSESPFPSRKLNDCDLQSLHKCRTILNAPRDHVYSVDELSLHLGDWYYLDGAGHEHGPSSYAELQELVAKGTIMKESSVFRKDDNIWLPISGNAVAPGAVQSQEERITSKMSSSSSGVLPKLQEANNGARVASHPFHSSYPQFVGYTRGKLHELVMRSYKNREFASAINEVLDPWLSAKQPNNEIDKHFPFNSSISRSSILLPHELSGDKFWKSEDGVDNVRAGKRARLLFVENDEEIDLEGDLLFGQLNDCVFEDICTEAVPASNISPQSENENWGLLNGRILARVFHFLRKDMNSLVFSAATCKHWKVAADFYKSISRCVDLSPAGPACTDSMFRGVMSGYDKKNLTSVILSGCSNISASALEEVLQLFSCINLIDIRGCNQFKDVKLKFQNVKCLKDFGSGSAKSLEDSHSKIRSLKQITEKNNYALNLDGKDSSNYPFRQSDYKRTKIFDARKSSAALSRDARMRQLLRKKSENAYRKMEEYISSSLKDIMKGNRFEFFRSKVAGIEDRMTNGYYVRHGLDYIKDDIRRMCRDAFKSRSRADAADMKQIVMLFNQLIKSLDGKPKMLKYDSDDNPNSSMSKYGKRHNKSLNEKRCLNSNNHHTSSANGGTEYFAYGFDRENRKSLSKLNKRDVDSETDTSDDHDDDLFEVGKGGGESTDSDTESDLDLRSGRLDYIKSNGYLIEEESFDSVNDDREWGARMTKASLVPPVTRKYEVIDRYLIVADEEEVRRKMQVALPEDYAEKLLAQKNSTEESDMELPEVKEYKPRKVLGEEVLEQEVYGIDPYTHNLLLDSMPEESEWPITEKHKFIEEVLLRSLNKQVRHFTGTGNAPMVYPLRPIFEEIQTTAEEEGNLRIVKLCQTILKAMHNRPDDKYVSYRKGLGVVCNKEEGFSEDDFVVEFLGEVYPAWKWFEKQDGIRSLQKDSTDPAPEFYNIYLERPKGDRDGYDLVVVDAMHKANYASRICHSCRPNCEAKVTAVDGHYLIGIYSVRPIGYGEEITFDYNSVTESKEEYEASVCLCGSQVCRGSYLNLTGEGAFQKVLKDSHGMLDRHKLMLEACEANSVSQEDYIDLARAGLGTCLLSDLPEWLVAYSAHLVRFINFERTKLPEEILKHNLEEKRKFFPDICLEVEKSDAEVQAEGVYNARLQNMALTLDKVRYVMRSVFGDPKRAPPPLRKLSPEDLVSFLWKGECSLVEELLQCMAPHIDGNLLNDLKLKIHAHDPSGSDDLRRELKKSLLWLRDELRSLPCTQRCRHDAAADLIHMYAYTKCFFEVREYKTVHSPPVYISPLDLGPKYVDRMGSGFREYCKAYGENYCLGQLIYWHSQTNADPDSNLARARRGCLSMPDIASFYAKSQKPLREHIYGSRTLRFMLSRMEKQPQRPWPKDQIWVFKSNPRIFGSPMLDSLLNKCPLDKEMMQWLKSRPSVHQSVWDG